MECHRGAGLDWGAAITGAIRQRHAPCYLKLMKTTLSDTNRPALRFALHVAAAALFWLTTTAGAAAQGFQSVESIRAAALAAIPDAESAGTTIELGLDPQLKLPLCAQALSASQSGRNTIEVGCPEGWRLYVPLRIRRIGPVVVLARPVTAGTLLEPAHLRIEERDLSRLSTSAFDTIESVVGKQVARSLGAGAVLASSDVKSPASIRRGDAVTLIARSGGIEVRAAGRAVTDGSMNESLTVRNLVTQRVLQGTLRENGVVELVF
jgi:flagellar basal body P-ring formation protein FlgA